MIRGKKEILFENNFDKETGADIITTGNELKKQEIAEFSKKINIELLYGYALSVKENTDEWLKSLRYEDIKKKFGTMIGNEFLSWVWFQMMGKQFG